MSLLDSAGQKLAYVYFEDEPGRRSAAKLLGSAPAPRTLSHSLSGNKPLIHRFSQRAEKHLLANDVADGTSPGHEDVQQIVARLVPLADELHGRYDAGGCGRYCRCKGRCGFVQFFMEQRFPALRAVSRG